MEKISINKNGLGIFKRANAPKETKKNTQSASNPFGIHFKGNITQADVFIGSGAQTTILTKKAHALNSKIQEKLAYAGDAVKRTGNRFKSAIVGGYNSFNNALKERINGIVAFGRKVKESIKGAIEFSNTYDVGKEAKKAIQSFCSSITNIREYSIPKLLKKPVSELSTMLQDNLKAENLI